MALGCANPTGQCRQRVFQQWRGQGAGHVEGEGVQVWKLGLGVLEKLGLWSLGELERSWLAARLVFLGFQLLQVRAGGGWRDAERDRGVFGAAQVAAPFLPRSEAPLPTSTTPDPPPPVLSPPALASHPRTCATAVMS